MLGDVHAVLRCHVIDNLSTQLILGYPDLKALKAVIDTSSNEVRIVKPSGLSGSGPSGLVLPGSGLSDSVVTPCICSMVSSLRLPGQHHAYVDIRGPPNSATFVATPPDMVFNKLLSVAAGIVNFNDQGIATVKLANLDKETKILNKSQIVATYQYLSPSLRAHTLNQQIASINKAGPSSAPSIH
ncbi:hypothetical protein G6F61_013322 [Rhizopus arrhizus]|nr:hypothetical protein G6F42_026050 [Rhizopus arrhizus]KAG1366099.1 hypothetical protein G6F61_013322 [Rhizopus arrhizus]